MAEETKKKSEDEEKKENAEGGEESAVAEGGDEAVSNAAKKKKKIMIIVGAVVALLLLGGGGAAFFLMSGGEKKEAAEEDHAEKGKPAYYPLGDMIVNLSGEGKRPNYLKVKVTLELADGKDSAVMDQIKPRIIDNFQVYLRELRIEDLRGSAGMYRLREELLMRVTEAAQPIRIRDVLFQEMLVQ